MNNNQPTDFIHVWHGMIEPFDLQREGAYQEFLSLDEQKKANAFKRDDLKHKYRVSRAKLRFVLAEYLGCQPQQIRFELGDYGKPYVVDSPVYFNLSHSGDVLVIAISSCEQIGVDVEQYQDRKSLPSLVEKCFSSSEVKFWKNLNEEQRLKVFYQFWVRKEAFVKAVGRGIALGLENCVLDTQSFQTFIDLPSGYGKPSNWKIDAIDLWEQYASAVVVNVPAYKFELFQW